MSTMVVPSACNAAQVGDIAKAVLMPGDPLRAKVVAETYLQNPICFNSVRGMLGYTGTYKGKRISVMGSGMGIPSMCLYSHELYQYYGVDAIIRIGSTGGLAEHVKMRDIVLAMVASTNSNYAAHYKFPGILAPAADYGMLSTAEAAAKRIGACPVVGSVFTSDQFYPQEFSDNEHYRRMGMLAVDMETAGLYYNAMAAHKKALSILTVSDHLFTGEALTAEERQDSFKEMMEVALETAWATIE